MAMILASKRQSPKPEWYHNKYLRNKNNETV